MVRKLRKYQEFLLEELQDEEFANLYLNQALADEDPRMFLLALKNIHEARGGSMTELAQKTNLSREHLYRILSEKGNPTLTSFVALLNAVGISMVFQTPKKK